MRTSQAAIAIFAAASLNASTAQVKRYSSLRENRRRELNEFGNGLSLSMSIPEEDFEFGFSDDTSVSLSLPEEEEPKLHPPGFKWVTTHPPKFDDSAATLETDDKLDEKKPKKDGKDIDEIKEKGQKAENVKEIEDEPKHEMKKDEPSEDLKVKSDIEESKEKLSPALPALEAKSGKARKLYKN